MARERALGQLNLVRETFYYAAVAYAALRSGELAGFLSQYELAVHEKGVEAVKDGERRAGISYRISFDALGGQLEANSLIEKMFEKMISDSVDSTRQYARTVNEIELLHREDWFAMAVHLRNAFSHNGKWSFDNKKYTFPVKWRRFTLERELEGQSASGFLPIYDGMQLCAQMINYVSGVVDYKQERIPR